MSRWLELRVEAADEAAEAVAELLSHCTGRGIAIEQAVSPDPQGEEPPGRSGGALAVIGYLLDGEQAQDTLRQAQEGLWHLGQLGPRVGALAVRPLEEEDWATAWRQHFHVTRAGRRCVIVPTWREHAPGPEEIIIALDPGMAFGTGLHPTTRLCLGALEDYTLPSMDMLDLGTGSGILAIAAAKLGARRVLALDTDPVAV
ncbi:MAG: 50S ribosomal protein L11 methyltransferase, partial [Chloroflexi bacterium]|nr:50S ribosomal protein L11 methyltransferase [Chloroflexota bacterium]